MAGVEPRWNKSAGAGVHLRDQLLRRQRLLALVQENARLFATRRPPNAAVRIGAFSDRPSGPHFLRGAEGGVPW